MHAAIATQKAPKDKRPACTFTGPNRSRRFPRAMRTKIVEPTAATPAFAMMWLQLVPAVQTQLERGSVLLLLLRSSSGVLGIRHFCAVYWVVIRILDDAILTVSFACLQRLELQVCQSRRMLHRRVDLVLTSAHAGGYLQSQWR